MTWETEVAAVPGIEDVPSHPVVLLQDQGALFSIGGNVFAAVPDEDSDYFYENFYEIKTWWGLSRKKFPLAYVGRITDLDKIGLNRVLTGLEDLGDAYAARFEASLGEVKTALGKLDLAQLVTRDVMPYFRAQKYKDRVAQLLGQNQEDPDSEKNFEQSLTKAVARVATKVEEEKEAIRRRMGTKRSARDRKLDKLLDLEAQRPLVRGLEQFGNFAWLDGALHRIYRADSEKKTLGEVTIADKMYDIGKGVVGKNLDIETRLPLGQFARLQAMQRHFTPEKIKAIVKGENLELLARREVKTFDEGGFGLISEKGSKYRYVFLTVPPFAIKSQYDERHYFFQKTRIGINVWSDKNRLKYNAGFYMADNNNHPFLHLAGGNFQQICIGSQKFPTNGGVGEVIVRRLLLCRELLMHGYTGMKYYPCYRLTKVCRDHGYDHYKKNRTTEEWLKENNIPIIQGGPRE